MSTISATRPSESVVEIENHHGHRVVIGTSDAQRVIYGVVRHLDLSDPWGRGGGWTSFGGFEARIQDECLHISQGGSAASFEAEVLPQFLAAMAGIGLTVKR